MVAMVIAIDVMVAYMVATDVLVAMMLFLLSKRYLIHTIIYYIVFVKKKIYQGIVSVIHMIYDLIKNQEKALSIVWNSICYFLVNFHQKIRKIPDPPHPISQFPDPPYPLPISELATLIDVNHLCKTLMFLLMFKYILFLTLEAIFSIGCLSSVNWIHQGTT